MTIASIPGRGFRKLYRIASLALHRDDYTGKPFYPPPDLVRLGTEYGGWVVPASRIRPDSICYCVGCGEDVSFDLELIRRFGCDVWAFDPTPRGIRTVTQEMPPNPKYHFTPVGLWDREEMLKFYVPANPIHDSYSAVNLQHTKDYVLAPVKRLSQIMQENGHTHLDLLKIDIEGSEYKVIDSLLQDKLDVRLLCVEYDEYFNPLDANSFQRICDALASLESYGFRLIHSQGKANYTLARNP